MKALATLATILIAIIWLAVCLSFGLIATVAMIVEKISRKLLGPVALSTWILFSGCATSTDTLNKAKPFLRPSSTAIGVATILTAKTSQERQQRADYLFAAATAVRTLSGSTAPTSHDLEASLQAFAPQTVDDDWTQLILGLSSLWQSILPTLPNDTKAVLDALEQIAGGLEKAATPFLAK